jgi:hypothetical protein
MTKVKPKPMPKVLYVEDVYGVESAAFYASTNLDDFEDSTIIGVYELKSTHTVEKKAVLK